MKTYVLTLSQKFPARHPRSGEPTDFVEKLRTGHIERHETFYPAKIKIHTIRANYPLWEKRFEEIKANRATLSVRQSTGKPYCSKQRVICNLTASDGIGLQRLEIGANYAGLNNWQHFKIDGRSYMSINDIPTKDGLSREDWINWFKSYYLTKPMAIIHFTNFRY